MYNFQGTTSNTLSHLFGEAKAEISKLNIGEEFILQDLFTRSYWNSIPRHMRVKFGIHFSTKIKGENISRNGTSSGKNLYIKTEYCSDIEDIKTVEEFDTVQCDHIDSDGKSAFKMNGKISECTICHFMDI